MKKEGDEGEGGVTRGKGDGDGRGRGRYTMTTLAPCL